MAKVRLRLRAIVHLTREVIVEAKTMSEIGTEGQAYMKKMVIEEWDQSEPEDFQIEGFEVIQDTPPT